MANKPPQKWLSIYFMSDILFSLVVPIVQNKEKWKICILHLSIL